MRKPRFMDSMFAVKVDTAMKSGELTWSNIREWNRILNDGIDPVPQFNTREIMEYLVKHPNYFVGK